MYKLVSQSTLHDKEYFEKNASGRYVAFYRRGEAAENT
jgi:hypothetical protein